MDPVTALSAPATASPPGSDPIALLAAFERRAESAFAPNTVRAWRSDWAAWSAFCRAVGSPTLPTTVALIEAFLRNRIAAGRKRATLEHYLATLSTAHQAAGLASPMASLDGRLMWRAIRRELPKRQRQARGLIWDDVAAMVGQLRTQRPRDARDAALLSVAYDTMCRRSELVALRADDLTTESDGSGRLLLRRGKTDQDAEGALLYVSPSTMAHVHGWLTLAAIATGPLFRSTPKSTRPDRFARPLSDRDIARIFKRCALAAGIDPELVSGHSTRVGGAQDLLAHNITTGEIMRAGRWKTERMITRYGEALAVGRGGMAQLAARQGRAPKPGGRA